MRCIRVICFILLYLLSPNSNNLSAQGKLSEKWIPNPSDTSYENIIEHLEKDYQLSFSYSPNILNQGLYFSANSSSSIKALFDLIFIENEIEYELQNNTRVLLFINKDKRISISGVIRDFESKESIPAASILIKETGEYIVATDDGYFYLEAENQDSLTLTFNSVTYSEKVMRMTNSESKVVIELLSDINASIVVITPSVIPNDYIKKKTFEGINPLGLSEITEQIKSNPMVQNGNEGQTGFVVKGGSPDQNFILLDGMPVYNVSHIGGLSSIFISSAVKEVKLYTSGISAEYGGKLSSVMDVKINEGNTEEYHANVTIGITGAEAHVEGPLVNKKTAISLSGRYSWLNVLSNSFFENFGGYDKSDINYYDFYAKLHHKISPTNRLSLSYYKGNDRLNLFSTETIDQQQGKILSSVKNDFNWGNELASLQWNRLIFNKISINAKLGFSKYNLTGSGKYLNEGPLDESKLVGTTASSEIQNLVAGIKFDIYNTSIGKVNVGANVIRHSFKPQLLETVIKNDTIITQNEGESLKSEAVEVNGFIENEIELGENISFRGGLHLSSFGDQDTSYYILEPRAKLTWHKGKHVVDLNLSINHQYIHLLTNPGAGLPSDLWVPSGKSITPSKAQELSIGYSYKVNEKISFESQAYVKSLSSIKQYEGTSDVIFKLLGDDLELGDFVTSEPDWRKRIEEGRGFSSGVGVLLKYEEEKLNVFTSYTFSYTSYLFPGLEDEYFFARHHRPHDLLFQVSYKITDQWHMSAKFVYGSGINYTFPDEYILGPPPSYIANFRNGKTLDAFHHMDVNFKYRKKLEKALLEINAGIYNLYNRENIFYTYLNLDDNNDPEEKKFGLLPFLPNATMTISF